MSKKLIVTIVSIIAIVAGVLLVAFADTRGTAPELVCAEANAPTSGFRDASQNDCGVTAESFKEYSDWRSQPQPLKIVGLFITLAGVAGLITAGVTAAVQKSRRN